MVTPLRPTPATSASVRLAQNAGLLIVSGAWSRERVPEGAQVALAAIAALPAGSAIRVEAEALTGWDSTLAAFLLRAGLRLESGGGSLDVSSVPVGLQRLLALARAVPDHPGKATASGHQAWVDMVGVLGVRASQTSESFLTFLGETVLSLGRALQGQARFRARDVLLLLDQAGSQALGVVALVNFLVGLILAFVAAIQLAQFGAAIYVANLVAIATLRDMAAIMTAIVLAGRSGAAYAATLGTMNTNQELDALRVAGISPYEHLVLPRLLALVLMTPFLALFADAMGIAGGAVVATRVLDIPLQRYLEQARDAVTMGTLLGGVFKATCYGALVALAGCWRGMTAGRTAAAVGEATTRAVVTAIVFIISAAGLFAVLFHALGI